MISFSIPVEDFKKNIIDIIKTDRDLYSFSNVVKEIEKEIIKENKISETVELLNITTNLKEKKENLIVYLLEMKYKYKFKNLGRKFYLLYALSGIGKFMKPGWSVSKTEKVRIDFFSSRRKISRQNNYVYPRTARKGAEVFEIYEPASWVKKSNRAVLAFLNKSGYELKTWSMYNKKKNRLIKGIRKTPITPRLIVIPYSKGMKLSGYFSKQEEVEEKVKKELINLLENLLIKKGRIF